MHSPVCIDVGGFHHYTTEETLRKSRTLCKLLDERESNDAPMFVDRDGVSFLHVLYFLRSGSVGEIDSANYIRFLLEDAAYYGLDGMKDLLSGQLVKMTQLNISKEEKHTAFHEKVIDILQEVARKLEIHQI